MKLRPGLTVFALCLAAVAACTNDYDEFAFSEFTGGSAGSGATGGSAGAGGAITGGTGGAITGGTGGIITGGTGGTAGTAGTAGSAGSAGCASGQKDCGGTCVATDDPAFGCGATGCAPCAIANATTQCFNGQCALLSCDTNRGDCNTNLGDGCEQTLDTTEHCGACDRACGKQKSTGATCTAGTCSHTCEAGSGDCVQPATGADDGCETDITNTVARCGSCANDCSKQGASGGFACNNGLCGCKNNNNCRVGGGVGGTCDSGSGLCSCGGTTCVTGEACTKKQGNDVCACNGGDACTAGQTCCQTPAGCKDLQTDAQNCGACGAACPSGKSCVAGACQ